MAKSTLILRWMGINWGSLGISFVLMGLLIGLLPNLMLSLYGSWATLLSSLGARTAIELASPSAIFWHIVQRNLLAALVYFLIGLLLQAPIGMIFGGGFYALIVFLAPQTIRRSLSGSDWLLITIEMGTLVLAASLGMGVAGAAYDVSPGLRSWWEYSKQSWRTIAIKIPEGWRETLSDWIGILFIGGLITTGLVLFVAWYETYGY
jgi:hypothetical protein